MGAAPGCEYQNKPRTLEPGRNLGRHSLLRGLDCEREKPHALWGPKSLLSEPGEPVSWEEAFPFGFPRETRDGLELSGISGQREGPSLPQVQLAPGHRAGGPGGRRGSAEQSQAVPKCAQRERPERDTGQLSRPEPCGSFEVGEGSTFPVELTSAVSGTLWYPSDTVPPSFLWKSPPPAEPSWERHWSSGFVRHLCNTVSGENSRIPHLYTWEGEEET